MSCAAPSNHTCRSRYAGPLPPGLRRCSSTYTFLTPTRLCSAPLSVSVDTEYGRHGVDDQVPAEDVGEPSVSLNWPVPRPYVGFAYTTVTTWCADRAPIPSLLQSAAYMRCTL